MKYQTPRIFTADENTLNSLKNNYTQTVSKDGHIRYVIARPLVCENIFTSVYKRIRSAWMALTGQADLIVFIDQ